MKVDNPYSITLALAKALTTALQKAEDIIMGGHVEEITCLYRKPKRFKGQTHTLTVTSY